MENGRYILICYWFSALPFWFHYVYNTVWRNQGCKGRPIACARVFCHAQLLPSRLNHSSMHGRRKGGGRGSHAPWILKLLAKKGCFFQFRGVKSKFHHFWQPPGKNIGKISYCSPPPGKNPSDAHASTSCFGEGHVHHQCWTGRQVSFYCMCL